MLTIHSTTEELLQLNGKHSHHSLSRRRFRRGSVFNLVLIGILALLLLGIGTYFFATGSGPSSLEQPLSAKAFKGPFSKEVLDQGEIQSSENVEIRCKVKSRYGSKGVTVQEIIEEGTMVTEGDLLVTLRSDEIEANYESQVIAVTNAKDSVLAATNNLQAEKAAKLEYLEGKYTEERGLLLNAISQAEEELDKAKEYLKFSKKLQAKSFITRTQLRSDEAALERAERTLESAKRSLLVLDKYTLEKNEKQFESNINIAQSKLTTAQKTLQIEEKTLSEIEEQLAACEIRVPEGQKGQVVYANIFSRRGSAEFVLEEGASVREGQVLIRLPNPTKMQVRATVNESRVTSIKEDMPVVIAVDALNGKTLEGRVTKVNQYAEPEGWGGGGVRKFAVYIEISNPIPEIRPGMNASVTVETERLEDVLMIPIQAVYGYRGKTFCLRKVGEKWETVEVEVGSNNDTNVVVNSGISEGDELAMNPAGFKELLELPDLPVLDESEKDKNQRSGKSPGSKGKKSKGGPSKKSQKGGPPKEKSPSGKSGEKKTTFKKSGNGKQDALKAKTEETNSGTRPSGTNADSA